MAVSDLLLSLVLLSVEITQLVTDSKHWYVSGIVGSIFCKLVQLVSLAFLLVSVQSLVWIAIDRFVAVVFPMKLGLISSKIRTIAIVSTWICATFVRFPSLIFSKLVVRGNDRACTDTNMESFPSTSKAYVTYVWLQFSLFIVAPLVVITVLYTAIAFTLNRQKTALAGGTPSNAQRHAMKKRRQAIKMAVAILVLFYLCVAPLTLVYFVPNWKPCVIQSVLYLVTSFALYLSSTVNPLICLSFIESYRRGLRNILCPCDRKLNGNVTPKCGEINLVKMKTPQGESYRQPFKNTKNYNEAHDTIL